MLNWFGNIYAYVFGWPLLSRIHLGLYYLCARALGLHNYKSPSISGERKTIQLGRQLNKKPVIFDVGANEGDWLADVLATIPGATIHAFEPQARLAQQIGTRYPQVTINNMALGDVAGTLDLYDYAEHTGSQHASLLQGVIDGIHHGQSRRIEVEVGTLDDYCAKHGINRIDVLKIDVEGFELKVLNGAKRMLAQRAVHIIQFEFNEMNVVAKTFLSDFETYLKPTHRLFRLLPHGLLPLRPGSHWANEQFIFQNIIALPRP